LHEKRFGNETKKLIYKELSWEIAAERIIKSKTGEHFRHLSEIAIINERRPIPTVLCTIDPYHNNQKHGKSTVHLKVINIKSKSQ